MITVRQFKNENSYEKNRLAMEELGKGLTNAMSALDKEYRILTPEEIKAAESLQNALTALSDKNANQLPDETVRQHLKTIEDNRGFFALEFGTRKKTVLDRTGISPERISDIEQSLQTDIVPTIGSKYGELESGLSSIKKNVTFKSLEQELKFELAQAAFSILRNDPELTGDKVFGVGFYLSDGKRYSLLGTKPAAYAMVGTKNFWNEEVGYRGRTKKIRDIFLETAGNELERKKLSRLIEFSETEADGRIRAYTDQLDEEYIDNLPEDIRARFRESEADVVLGRFEAKEPLFTGVPAVEGRTAYARIDDLKADIRQTIRQKGADLTPEDIQENIAKIMAARMLVNAERNKPRTLQHNVTDQQINDLAQKIRKSKTFSSYINHLGDNENEAEFRKVARLAVSGHGGEMEAHFKEFIKNQPACEFVPEQVMERYNPTALERIEALQDKIKKHQLREDHEANKKAMIEIIACRNAVNAERNNKESLNVKIPATKMYAYTCETLFNDKDVRENLDPPVPMWDIARKGHGGELLDTVRTKYKEYVEDEKFM